MGERVGLFKGHTTGIPVKYFYKKQIYIYIYCVNTYVSLAIIRVYCLSRSPNSFTDDALNLSKDNIIAQIVMTFIFVPFQFGS